MVLKSSAMAGKPGKYISIANGAMADSDPRISITTVRFAGVRTDK